jgi:hypothetical protein
VPTIRSTTPAWSQPITLTLYFGVGTEMNRHGIRAFYKSQGNMNAFLQVQGIEKPQFGIAIDDAQIKTALARSLRGRSRADS